MGLIISSFPKQSKPKVVLWEWNSVLFSIWMGQPHCSIQWKWSEMRPIISSFLEPKAVLLEWNSVLFSIWMGQPHCSIQWKWTEMRPIISSKCQCQPACLRPIQFQLCTCIGIITRQSRFYYKGEGSIKSIIHVIMIILKSLMPPSKTSWRAALRILVLP